MGINALVVLDGVRDVNRVLGEMTVNGSSGPDQEIVDSLRDDVYLVERDCEYHPGAAKDDRLYVQMLCCYWYPGELHYSPGNWYAVSNLCEKLWTIEPTIVVHYMPECDFIDELTADELIKEAHLLTPASVAELDDRCSRAEHAIELRNKIGRSRAQSQANDSYGVER